jgi:hypothetical protein
MTLISLFLLQSHLNFDLEDNILRSFFPTFWKFFKQNISAYFVPSLPSETGENTGRRLHLTMNISKYTHAHFQARSQAPICDWLSFDAKNETMV